MVKNKVKNSKSSLINSHGVEQHKFFFENVADAIFIADSKTKKIVECNKKAEKLTGYSREKILSMKALELHPKDKVKETMMGFVNQIKKGGVLRTEILTKNKKRIPVSVNAKLIKVENKSYLQGVFRDITDIVKFENILRDNEERFHGLFESANDAIWLMDKSTFVDCNLKAVEMFNCDDKADMVNHTPIQFSPIKQPDGQYSKDKALMYIKKALNGQPQRFYWQHKRKDGSLFDAEIALNRLVLQGNTYLQAIGRDISENKKAEENILRINRAIKMVSSINQVLIHFNDLKELLNEACRIAVEVGGYSLAWVGFAEHDKMKTIRPVAHAGIGSDYIKKAKLTWANNKHGNGPSGMAIKTMKFHISRLISKDKTMTPWRKNALKYGYQSSIALPLINNKKAFGMIAIYSNKIDSFNIEEVKILKELADDLAFGINTYGIREDVSKFKKAVQTSGEVMYITNTDGVISYINSEFTKTYGYTYAEIVGKVTPRVLKSGLRKHQEYVNLWKDLLTGKVVKDEHWNKAKNGRLIMVESMMSPIFGENKKIIGFLAIQSDITERKKTEDKLIESEERFRNIFNYSAVGVSVVSTSGRWLEVNDALCKITGYSRKELLNENFSDITFIDDKAKGPEFIKKMMSGEIDYAQFDKRYIHKNGHIIWVSISTALVRDALGKPLYFVTHTQDISSLKKLEQAKDDFLSMASHQLRTPLSAIKWILETLKDASNFTPQQKDKIDNLIISNKRIINLVNYLLNVTKIESGKLIMNKSIINVNELFNKLVLALKNLTEKKKKNIKITIPSQIKNIYCDPLFLSEALSNLLHNAIVYSEENSKDIDLKISEREKDYLISIHNDGFIDSATLEKIKKFGKFVRGDNSPKIKPEGSGLGLYLAKSIIESSGGKLWCESNIKSGTTFYLTIIKEKTKR
ncbi:MAG: PAS domain S-box protein [Candidatus Paceibacterota bacterium]|jgi:PAS domain S-box-containing protein